MKQLRSYFAIIFVALACSMTAFGDVKIKSRQTAGGQTFENTTYIKGKRQRTEQSLGGMITINLTQCDQKRGIQINPATLTYLVSSYVSEAESSAQDPAPANPKEGMKIVGGTITSTITYKNTGETKKMFGYTASHVITTIKTVSSPDACSKNNSNMEIDGWYIDAAFALECDSNRYTSEYIRPKSGGCRDKYLSKTTGNGKRGFPVFEKMSMLDDSGRETFSSTTEVVELSQANLDQALFEIPADYREVDDPSQLYAYNPTSMPAGSNSGVSSTVLSANQTGSRQQTSTPRSAPSAADPNDAGTELPAKVPGTIRIGLTVRTGTVGDGLNSRDLGEAVRNTFAEYLQGTNIELVFLETKLAKAIEKEARDKECDYVVSANISHKKGGGGGGLFGKVLAPAIGRTGIGHTGSTAGNIAGQIATQSIVSAGSVSGELKSKDELTLEVRLQPSGGGSPAATQFKAKAKSDGEDIISSIVEKAAEFIVGKAII